MAFFLFHAVNLIQCLLLPKMQRLRSFQILFDGDSANYCQPLNWVYWTIASVVRNLILYLDFDTFTQRSIQKKWWLALRKVIWPFIQCIQCIIYLIYSNQSGYFLANNIIIHIFGYNAVMTYSKWMTAKILIERIEPSLYKPFSPLGVLDIS